jgi:hypothetical protein
MANGGIAMSSGGNSGGTQTTRAEPWDGQQAYLRDVFSQAQALSRTPQPFYPGRTYAAPAAETLAAQQLQARRAAAGSPVANAATRNLAGTLDGSYLRAGNPYFGAMLDRTATALLPRIDSHFESAGRYGSGAYARASASALTDAASRLAYGDYAQERQNQLRAAALAPDLAQQDYLDLAKLAEVGAAKEDLQQQAINEAMNRYTAAQNEPWQRLARYAALVQGNYGGTTTTAYSGPRRTLGQGLLGNTSPFDAVLKIASLFA